MTLIADMMLGAGALGAAVYCFILARRLKRFTQLESGMGGAIAVLSAQVDDMTRALESARRAASASTEGLEAQTERAQKQADRLELLLASMHDLPEDAMSGQPSESEARGRSRARVIRRRSPARAQEGVQ